jgi:hypothetical protein
MNVTHRPRRGISTIGNNIKTFIALVCGILFGLCILVGFRLLNNNGNIINIAEQSLQQPSSVVDIPVLEIKQENNPIVEQTTQQPISSITTTTTTTPQESIFSLKTCSNHLLRDFDHKKLQSAIIDRLQWIGSEHPYNILQSNIDKNMRDGPKVAPDDQFADKSITPWRKYAVGGSWSFFANTHARFDLMGPVYDNLCPRVEIFGKDDEEKRFCVDTQRTMFQPGCTVFSIGSNNIWEFEKEIAAKTPCMIYTFDCTIGLPTIPQEIKDRVKFFHLCLGKKTNGNFRTYWDLLKEAGLTKFGPTLLKMDVEGYEWDFFESLLNLKESEQDLFPLQMAVEVHFLALIGQSWYGRDMSPGEFLAMFNHLFIKGGYVIAQRRDNPWCNACSEILLVKAGCFHVEG